MRAGSRRRQCDAICTPRLVIRVRRKHLIEVLYQIWYRLLLEEVGQDDWQLSLTCLIAQSLTRIRMLCIEYGKAEEFRRRSYTQRNDRRIMRRQKTGNSDESKEADGG